MSLNPDSRAKFNLKNAQVLVAETGAMSVDLVVQIISGFGAKDIQKAETMDLAKAFVTKMTFDLIIVGSVLGGGDGYEFVEWIRRSAPDSNKYVPVLMVTSHTAQAKIESARDCGAHFIIAKPLTPSVMLERILWIARKQRGFVACSSYVGPDRRFKFDGPPAGCAGRRSDDLSANLGDAVMPNMSQDQIDALLQPRAPA
jgi:DNA-binding response OmpR family regulator